MVSGMVLIRSIINSGVEMQVGVDRGEGGGGLGMYAFTGFSGSPVFWKKRAGLDWVGTGKRAT